MNGYPSRTQQQTHSLQIEVDRAYKCESAVRSTWKLAWRRASALRQALPTTAGQPCLRSRDQLPRVEHGIMRSSLLIERLKPPQQQQSPRVLLLSFPEQQYKQKRPLRRRRRLLRPPQHGAQVAAIVPADALTAAPPVPSASATAPATAHEETIGAGNTSARRWFTNLVAPPPRARQHINLFADHSDHPILSTPLDWGSPTLSLFTG